MRVRLRPAWDEENLQRIYGETYDSERWVDHRYRVALTGILAEQAIFDNRLKTAADLSCGDGRTLDMASGELLLDDVHKGDITSGWRYTGPIEETIHQIPNVDLFICSETLEHLDDPDSVLRKIRDKTHYLLLSTPIGETGTKNEQHYWGWDQEDFGEMLRIAGFEKTLVQVDLKFPDMAYDYQIWLVE